MLSPGELAAMERGRVLKRCVRAAAALNDLYDDTAIAEAIGINRGAVGAWWDGGRIKTENLHELASITGLSADELTQYVYFGGPLPTLPVPGLLPVREGIRRGQARLADEAPGTQSQPPLPRTRGTGAGRG